MKILMLTRLYLPHIGGVELHIQNLIAHADKSDHFTIITERHDSPLPEYETQNRVEIYRIPMGMSKKISVWLWMAKHLNLLWSADVIHIHDVFFWLIPFLPILLHKRLTITFHGYEGNENPNSRQIFWHRVASYFTQANLCIGGFHEKWYGVTPTQISFGAVEMMDSQSSFRHPKKEKKLRLVYAGRLSADAGILSYMHGLLSLPKKLSDTWALDVYGDGECRKEAEAIVHHYNLPVRFHGFVPPEQIAWHTYDIALVSRHLAILEALAYEIPVIADADTAIKYDYLHLSPFAPWISIVRGEQEMIQALVRVLDPSKRTNKDQRTQAGKWARNQTWGKLYTQYIRLWQS